MFADTGGYQRGQGPAGATTNRNRNSNTHTLTDMPLTENENKYCQLSWIILIQGQQRLSNIIIFKNITWQCLLYLVGTGDVVVSALLLNPGRLPDCPVAVLVEVAAQNGEKRHQVENGEHADTDHELNQLLLVLLLQWDLHTDAVQCCYSRQQ